jgi:hypothetical protein
MSPWRCEIARGDLPRRPGMGANRVSGTNLRASSLLGHQQQGRSTTSALGDLGILGAVRSLTLRHMITILMRTWWAVCLKSRTTPPFCSHWMWCLVAGAVWGCALPGPTFGAGIVLRPHPAGLGESRPGSTPRGRCRPAGAAGRRWLPGLAPGCGDDVVELGAQQFLIRVHQREELLLYLIRRRDRHIAALRRRVRCDHCDHHRPALGFGPVSRWLCVRRPR